MLWEEICELLKVVGRAEDTFFSLGGASHNYKVERSFLPQYALFDDTNHCHGEGETIKLMRFNIDCIAYRCVFKARLYIGLPSLFKLPQDKLTLGLPFRSRL